MKNALIILFFASTQLLSAQSIDQNYIQTKTYTKADGSASIDVIQYFDGLGRSVQTVQKGITPNYADLVTYQEYDSFGRESNSWLPRVKTNNNGAFVTFGDFQNLSSSVYQNDTKAYSKPVYEPSPLNRIVEEYGPGQKWHDNSKSVKTEYLPNTASGVQCCAFYEVTSDGKLKRTNVYSANQLFVTKMTDEDGHVSYEFKDKLGQMLLTRQINNGQNHDTYYVYDDLGNRTFVIPPVLSDSLTGNSTWTESDAIIKRHAYLYRYDKRNREIAKRIPGCEWIYSVYDKADRLILSQDGEQRLKNEWTFNKYDALGRLVISGVYVDTKTREALETEYWNDLITETAGINLAYGYTWTKMPRATYDKTLLVNHYDDYEHLLNQEIGFRNYLNYETKAGYGTRYINPSCSTCSGKGLLVGTRIKLLDGSGEIVTAMYYDDKGNLIQKKSTNQLGGYDKEYYAYNFTGQQTNSLSEQTVPGVYPVFEYYTYEYDHAGRMIKTRYKVDNEAEIDQSVLTYDELGRVKSKKINNSSNSMISYSYNLRGWPIGMSSPFFSEFLTYETTSWIGGTPCYNGNISSIITALDGGDCWLEYNLYSYDGLNRLTSGGYNDWPNYLKNFFSYDKNGNIKTQQLFDGDGMGIANTYKYNGNQLLSFESAGSDTEFFNTHFGNTWGSVWLFPDGSHVTVEYTYDANGNMTVDYNKGISKIQYNYLNLPSLVQMRYGGHTAEYIYDASGVKRKEINKTATGVVTVPMGTVQPLTSSQIRYTEETYYLGNKEYYRDASGTLLLKKIHTPEGYVAVDGAQRIHHAYIKDHLGSVRIDHPFTGNLFHYCYLPFGGDYMKSQYSSFTINPLTTARFNGKERMPMFGIKTLDYGFRLYDPFLGRWNVPDPLCEKYYSISPYAYCANNPVNMIDPNGMDYYTVNDEGFVTLALVNDDEIDKLFAVKKSKEGKAYTDIEGAIGVSDKGILAELTSNSLDDFKGRYAETSNKNDAFNVFKFMADNTSVEWAVTGYKGNNYVLSTSNKYGYINGRPSLFSELNMTFDIHSHPTSVATGGANPSGSMLPDGSWVIGSGDMPVLTQRFINFQNARKPLSNYPRHYIYNVPSKGLYYYDHTYRHHSDPQKRFRGLILSGSDFINKM